MHSIKPLHSASPEAGSTTHPLPFPDSIPRDQLLSCRRRSRGRRAGCLAARSARTGARLRVLGSWCGGVCVSIDRSSCLAHHAKDTNVHTSARSTQSDQFQQTDAPRRTMTVTPAMWMTHHRPVLGKDCAVCWGVHAGWCTWIKRERRIESISPIQCSRFVPPRTSYVQQARRWKMKSVAPKSRHFLAFSTTRHSSSDLFCVGVYIDEPIGRLILGTHTPPPPN